MYTKQVLQESRAGLSAEKRALLKERLRGKVNASPSAIPRRPDNGPVPLTFSQMRLWFLFEWEPDSPAYNVSEMAQIKGAPNLKAIEEAYLEIARRHEILRTTYQYIDEQPVQVIAPSINWSLPLVDLGDLPAEMRKAETRRLAKEEAERPFDLRHDLPWRVVLVRQTQDEHAVFVTQHHISCDAWSVRIRNNEFETLYAAFATRKPSPLPELPIQYADFAHWRREQSQGPMREKLLAYWKKQLANLTPLRLPTDRPRPPVATTNGATQWVRLPPPLTRAIDQLCLQEGVTSFMVSLTALNVLLHRYTGQMDIVVGSSFANRDQPELERLIGFFIDTTVLRTDLSGNPTFRELLSQVRQVTLEAHAHKDLPIDHIIAEMQAERDLSRNLLVQVLFEWQDWRRMSTQRERASCSVERVSGSTVSAGTAKFDLSLLAEMQDEGIVCGWEYNTDLFDSSTITRLANHFQILLEGATANPDTRLSDLPLLTEEEQHQLLIEWNDTTVTRPQVQCVHDLFEIQADETPDAVAVVFGEQSLTYRELNRRANQVAHYLQSLGVGPEILVGMCVERTPEMVIGLLGVLKAGGAYVPLDPMYPRERLAFMLQDTQVSALLTLDHLVEAFPEYDGHTIRLDTQWKQIEQEPATNPATRATVDNLAYVIYTSGSTGRPKGVAVQHGSLASYTDTARAEFAVGLDDRILQFASLSFDTAAEEIYPCLASGATLVLRTDAMLGSVATFLQTCQEWAVTVLDLPTAYWHELVRGLETEGVAFCPAVRLVVIGGEKAIPEHLARWQACVSRDVRLLNTYGPTEATIVATASDLTTRVVGEKQVPIGRPIPNVQTYILDGHLQPVPIGVIGELHIGGVGVTRGYFDRFALTAQSFIPHPFSTELGARLYKTGDLARYQPDGSIKFSERVDHQVKIRGYRVEPGEIEARLGEHPAVQEAVVVTREDVPNEKYLVAYVVVDENQAFAVNTLRDFLCKKLPNYMIPSAFVSLDTLPLTFSGKIDRRALPAPDRTRAELERTFVAPSTLSEETLAEIWAQVLDVDQVGIYDNFFELGGHSMLAIQLMARVQDVFQLELSLRLFFERPTVAELAVAIDKVLLEEIESLSEDQVLQLLEGES
jgi:amino acid adenylation domain-containing protein